MSAVGSAGTRVRIESWLSDLDERSLANDVLDGLTRPFKELPPKHFYDARGSELFEQICELPEYYPTRTEKWLLQQHASEFAELTGARELVELGSGSAEKARILLRALAATLSRCTTCRSTSPRALCSPPPTSSWASSTASPSTG